MHSANKLPTDLSITAPAAPPVLVAQAQMNRSTRGQWAMYASHRQHLEQVILAGNPAGSICVLGAGNCNDLDLNWLTQIFQQVHLVDLDSSALADGVRRQKQEDSSKIHLHVPIDLSGIGKLIDRWHQSPPREMEIGECLHRLRQCDHIKIGAKEIMHCGFDVVLSPCLLSQLLIAVRDAIGSDHERYPALSSAVRQRHLRMMAQLLRPGGRGILAVDVASTENFPGLAQAQESDLADLMSALVAGGKCLRALTPAALRAALAQEREISRPRFTTPWRWRLGLSKAFLVYGITFQRMANRDRDPGRVVPTTPYPDISSF
jgi:hypothetical protein